MELLARLTSSRAIRIGIGNQYHALVRANRRPRSRCADHKIESTACAPRLRADRPADTVSNNLTDTIDARRILLEFDDLSDLLFDINVLDVLAESYGIALNEQYERILRVAD